MRFKIQIEEQYQTGTDPFGQPYYAWRSVCSAMASITEDRSGWLIRYTSKVTKPGRGVPYQRCIGNGVIAVIGGVETITQDGIKFTKISFSSVRGNYDIARTRIGTKQPRLPDAHNEHDENNNTGVDFL